MGRHPNERIDVTMQSTYARCPDCQKVVPTDLPECPHCKGKAQKSAARAASPIEEALSAPPFVTPCPVCGSNDVQKVSAICQAGTWTGTNSSSGVGVAISSDGVIPAFGGGDTKVQGATALAQRLSMDQIGHDPGVKVQGEILLCWVLFGLIFIAGGVVGAFDSGIVGFFLGGLAASAICGWPMLVGVIYYRRRQSMGEQKNVSGDWREMAARWLKAFYCAKCDSVFIPETQEAAPSHAMRALLAHKQS